MDVGARLRHAREAKLLTLDALSRITRVKPAVLRAIELNDPRGIPPHPYGRGFVRSYASEVGLDPDQVVRDYFGQFAVPADTSRNELPLPARERLALAEVPGAPAPFRTALPYVLAAVLVLALVAGRWALRATPEPGRVSSTPAAAAVKAVSAIGTVPAVVRAVGTASQPAASSASGVTVSLEATRPSWITAIVDGRRAMYRTLRPGERETLKGQREILLRAGDAGAVRWQVNGRPAAPLGKAGEVRTVRVTTDAGQ